MRRIWYFIIFLFIILSTINVSASINENDQNLIVGYGSSIVTDKPTQNESIEFYDNQTEPGTRALIVPSIEVQKSIKGIMNTVTEAHLRTYLDKLVGFGSRYYCAPGMFSAADWLYDVLEGNGRLEMEYHNFSLTTSEGTFELSNVILTLPGLDEDSSRIYYMFAHADSIQSDKPEQLYTNAPGANDDGSGCAAVLETARVLSYYDFRDTIKFAFFNAEELGSLGSEQYAQNMSARGENVRASLNYDMIGYSRSETEHGLKFFYHKTYTELEEYVEGVNSRYKIGLKITSSETPDEIYSDIWSFYQYGFPCILGNDADNDPHYHSTEDTVDKINFDLVEKSTRLAVASLAEWARLLYVDVSIPPGNLKVSDPKPNEDDLVNITVNVTNTGNLNAADLEVAFYADGKRFASNRITVPSSGSNCTSVYWQATDGSSDISVILDPSNEIIESDETNNNASITVSVNDRPNAVLNAYPTTAFTAEPITFNGSLSWDDIGGISEYNFDFGDGNSSDWIQNPTVSHAYSKAGSYSASLSVKDPDGAISKPVELQVQVKNRAPVAAPSSNLTHALTFTPIQFYSNAVDHDGTVTVHWTFGDGSETTEMNPIHSYIKSGRYDVCLKLQDDNDATSSYTMSIVIGNRPPISSVLANTNIGNITTNFIFTANATDPDGSIESYEWDFGDGYKSSMSTANHYYQMPGDYVVLLIVSDDEGYDTRAYFEVSVIDTPPSARGEALYTNPFTFEEVTFIGKDSYDHEGPLSYLWDFGDGNKSSEVSPVHIYMKPGNYSVELTVIDYSGQTNTAHIAIINVRNRPPVAHFRAFGDLTENGVVYFEGIQSYDAEGDLTFIWEFGDGTNGYGPLVAHIYSKPGSYYVNLTVTDESGESDKTQQLVTINETQAKGSITKESGKDISGRTLLMIILLMNICWIIFVIALFLWLKKRDKKSNVNQSIPEEEKQKSVANIYGPSPGLQDGQFSPTQFGSQDPVGYPTVPQEQLEQYPLESQQQLQLEPVNETIGTTKPIDPDLIKQYK